MNENAIRNALTIYNERYDQVIGSAIALLQQARNKPTSDHLGHNLANKATDLSVLAGKIAAMDDVLAELTLMKKEQ